MSDAELGREGEVLLTLRLNGTSTTAAAIEQAEKKKKDILKKDRS